MSIYISRATQKLYVRRNTHKRWPDGGEVFDASIEVPVTIRNPDRPIGTHVFTAMARDGAGLRWTAVTIDEGDDAKDALDRITIPQDVLDRIAPTAVPRSSIIVSDEPLSKETNYRTEFVAVLSNQPQGGFITRKVTPPDRPAWRAAGATTASRFSSAIGTPKPVRVGATTIVQYNGAGGGKTRISALGESGHATPACRPRRRWRNLRCAAAGAWRWFPVMHAVQRVPMAPGAQVGVRCATAAWRTAVAE